MEARKADPTNAWTDSIQSAPAARSFDDMFLEHWSSIYRLLVRMIGDPVEAEYLA